MQRRLCVSFLSISLIIIHQMKPTNRVFREIVRNPSVILQVVDKKRSEDIDWVDSENMETNIKRQDYHYTDSLGSRIGEQHVWSITEMIERSQRNATALKALKRHI